MEDFKERFDVSIYMFDIDLYYLLWINLPHDHGHDGLWINFRGYTVVFILV